MPTDKATMLHHVSLPVSDLAASVQLYDALMETLNFRRVSTSAHFAGYGVEDGKDKLALMEVAQAGTERIGFHIAFAAPSRSAVDAFYNAALANGASDNGSPGLRPHYGPNYYATFVIDLDGTHIEAVCKKPE